MSETLGQILDTAITDGSIVIDYDGVNEHLSALEPKLTFAPGSASGPWLQQHWIGPRVEFLGVAQALLSVWLAMAFFLFAWWAWPRKRQAVCERALEPAP